ncbi:MAG: hypothetical protein Q9198_007807, partial [Flavoplaca austrocitrina]
INFTALPVNQPTTQTRNSQTAGSNPSNPDAQTHRPHNNLAARSKYTGISQNHVPISQTNFTAPLVSGSRKPTSRGTSETADLSPSNPVLVRTHLPSGNLAVRSEYTDGVTLLRPTESQWEKFPSLLSHASQLGANNAGVCKVVVPKASKLGVPSVKTVKLSGRLYSSRRSETLFVIEHKDKEFGFPLGSSPTLASGLPSDLVEAFQQQLRNGSNDIPYGPDIDASTGQARASIGLPRKSPISPIQGDKLSETKGTVAGIHTPYAYIFDTQFGAPFALHVGDYSLMAVNHLYRG